jgi:hypothetical protein
MRPSNTTQDLPAVGYGNGTFAIGSYGISLSSTNGLSWTGYNLGSTSITSVVYANGVWCGGSAAIPSYGILTSTNNGNAWTVRFSPSSYIRNVAYANGTVVAVGDYGTICYSTNNGLTWNTALSPTTSALWSVAYGNGIWVAVGDQAAVVTSADGQLWTLQGSVGNSDCRSVAYGAGTFCAAEGETLYTSTNGALTWTPHTAPPYNYTGTYYVAYGNGIWVAVGPVGRILLSTNAAQTWTAQNSGIAINLSGVTYGNGMWVAVGERGTIISSQTSTSGGFPLVPNLQIMRAVELDWQSQDGAVYQVQSSSNMNTWKDTGYPILGDGQAKKFYDGANQPTKRFYRIQLK